MKVLLQRVSHASVKVDGEVTGEIEKGILAFIAIEPEDDEAKAVRMAQRVAGYRIFEDDKGKMNLNVKQVNGDVLVVSQFTLAADTSKGLRPSFTGAAAAEFSKKLYQFFCQKLREEQLTVPTGIFGADMKVSLLNDGPITFSLTL